MGAWHRTRAWAFWNGSLPLCPQGVGGPGRRQSTGHCMGWGLSQVVHGQQWEAREAYLLEHFRATSHLWSPVSPWALVYRLFVVPRDSPVCLLWAELILSCWDKGWECHLGGQALHWQKKLLTSYFHIQWTLSNTDLMPSGPNVLSVPPIFL